MSSNNRVIDDDNDDDNHGIHTFSRHRLGERGSLDDNDNYTDRHRRENRLPSSDPRINERQERMRAEKGYVIRNREICRKTVIE